MNLMDTLKPSTIIPQSGRIVGTPEAADNLRKAERKRVERIKTEIAKARRVKEKYWNRIWSISAAIEKQLLSMEHAQRMWKEAQNEVREWESKL